MNLSDVSTGLLGLAVLAAAVIVVALFGREPKAADEYTVADYEWRLRLKPAPPGGTDWRIPPDAPEPVYRRLRPVDAPTVPNLTPWDALTAPLADLGPAVEAPIYEHMAAALILRQLGVEARAKAGIRPAYDPARDMTGSFPVVRAA